MKLDKNKKVGTITFDVFGFSRGAAAARHFVHVVKHPPYAAKTGLLITFQKQSLTTYDLQETPISSSYKGKIMPEFGVLGQLLQEAELLDYQTKVNVRFVGIYDTVPHHGLCQSDDNIDLKLDDVNKADYVVHMVAADEYRANFDLVKISSVAKVSVDSGKKGGIELIYPGVHCDVGGAYVEGGSNKAYRINTSVSKKDLEDEKKEFIKQGWFREEEMGVYFYISAIATNVLVDGGRYRLEGKKENVSNQYSYIPLHIMSGFCQKKEVPINEATLFKSYKFKKNNKTFLQKIKNILWKQSFEEGPALVYQKENLKPEIDPITGKLDEKNIQHNIQERAKNLAIKNLRYHYLHWNATYGDPQEKWTTWLSGKNKPNMVDGKRKRNVH